MVATTRSARQLQAVGNLSTTSKAPAQRKNPVSSKTKAKLKTPRSALSKPSTRNDKKTPQKTKSGPQSSTADKSHAHGALLLELPQDVVIGELVCRPSKRNRSPYVADVLLREENENREVIVHVPNLDMGGKCVEGAKVLLKPARDKKGNLVGKDAVKPKYGTPKCEYIAQLLYVDESGLGYEPTWVGAHPSLGEKIAEQLIQRNLLGSDFPTVQSFQREVRNIAGTNMRADFVIQHQDPNLKPRILEVKTVVDTDYEPTRIPGDNVKCVFTSTKEPYTRTAIFPWGNTNQKGPDGERVVSSRAIKHVQELTKIQRGKLHDGQSYDTTILFIIIRHDAKMFRPNQDACPSFCKYLKGAKESGVLILAKQVRWGEGNELGKCFEGNLIDIDWPTNS